MARLPQTPDQVETPPQPDESGTSLESTERINAPIVGTPLIQGVTQPLADQYQQAQERSRIMSTADPSSPEYRRAAIESGTGLAMASIGGPENNENIFWHGSPSGDLRGSDYGLHLGSKQAAKEALEARIGVPVEGSWDGTREYGKTLLAGKNTLRQRGITESGYNTDVPDEDHYALGTARYGGKYGEKVSMDAKPEIASYKLKGEMSNTKQSPHEDFKANGLMAGQLKKGTAKRGYYYTNIGEDPGSLSIVVPSSKHIEKINYAQGGLVGYYADGGPVAGNDVTQAPAENTPQFTHIPMYDISQPQPQLGTMAHEEVQPSIESGQFSFPKGVEVPVFDQDGQLGTMAPEDAPEAFRNGYKYATPDMLLQHQYGEGLGNQFKAAIEGAAQGAIGPAAPWLETSTGLATPQAIKARARFQPWTHGAGEVVGLITSSMVGMGEGALLTKAGEAGAAALKLGGEGAPIISRIGSAATKGAIENMVFQSSDEASKMVLHDAEQSVGTAMMDVGLAGLIGGAAGGGIGVVSPLWSAASGAGVRGVLKGMADKVGGIDGHVADDVDKMMSMAGMQDAAPEIRASLAGDPQIRQIAKTLEQSDSTSSGLKFQETLSEFKKQMGDNMVTTLGHDPDKIVPIGEISKFETGKALGKTLADEFDARVSPTVKAFDKLREDYGSTPLTANISEKAPGIQEQLNKSFVDMNKAAARAQRAQNAGNPQKAIEAAAKVEDIQQKVKMLQADLKAPGTSDDIASRLGGLASKEGWDVSPSSNIMKELNRTVKEVGNLKTVGDIGKYITRIGENTFNPMDPALTRAGSMMKGVLKDAESDVIAEALGKKEGLAAAEQYRAARSEYKAHSDLKDALNDRLHIGGSASSYAKTIREYARTDGEALLNRLSGKNDADLLQLLQKNFPKTAEQLRMSHLSDMIGRAAEKAKPGENINSAALIKQIRQMSPELRNFAMKDPRVLQKIDAVSQILDKFNELPHNFSNTARVLDKLLSYVPGSAIGLATLLMGHGAGLAAALGALTKYIGRDIPDAARLALLKFVGSNNQISAEGFKAAAEMINSSMKGERLLSRAAKNLFVAGKEVLPETAMPSQSDTARLDKLLKSMQNDPTLANQMGQNIGHYMPEHGQQAAQIGYGAAQYLNSVRPQSSQNAPLDSKIKPSTLSNQAYNRTLAIAQQPLVVMKKIQTGSLTPKDVQDLKMVAPGAYKAMAQKVQSEMMEAMSKGQSIPYRTKLGLSIFLGQPMDSSMTPASIIAAQPKPANPMQTQQQQPNMGKPKRGTSSLNKLSKGYETPGQAAEANRTRGD